ncbi:MAG: NAD(P)H-dependent oxidoreductase [Spirochaetales bacterium]|nr:NAD(P)H-dependent oxidoreductase [Spirochaetales bacterium]
MKTLVIFYSYEGNCAFIAEKIKAALPEAELVRLTTGEDKKRGFFAKYAWGGTQVFSGKKPKLNPYSADPSAYDLVIIGTPVWAWSYAPAIKTFLEETKIEGKKIALFCCHGGGPRNTLEKLKKALPGNTFAGEASFHNPLGHTKGVQEKLDAWLKVITGGV